MIPKKLTVQIERRGRGSWDQEAKISKTNKS